MIHALLLATATLVSPTAAPQANTAPQATAAPRATEAGAKERWTFSENTTLSCDRLRPRWDDNDRTFAPFGASVTQRVRRSWVDQAPAESETRGVGCVSASPPFVRTYDDVGADLWLEIEQKGWESQAEPVAASPVVSKPIRFAWEPQTKAEGVRRLVPELLRPRPAAEEATAAAPDWLERIEPSLGFDAFVPETPWDETPPNASWTVPAAAMRALLAPTGDLPSFFQTPGGATDPDVIALFGFCAVSRVAGPNQGAVEGTVTARFRGIAEDDGERLAKIELSYDLTFQTDPGPWMVQQSRPFDRALVGQTATNARIECQIEGSGTLDWDVEAGRLAEVQLRSDVAMRQTFDFSFAIGTTTISGEYELDMSGTSDVELFVTAAK